jgi:alpha-beta hydrolase superfamily lysophospholipase
MAADQGSSEQPISLTTPTGILSGSMLLPAGKTPLPVVLIIAGSGPTDRDGNVAIANAYTNNLKYLAQALAQAGFASVRYDKRGLAGSAAAAPKEADLRFDTYVDDATAWLELLKGDQRFSSIGVVGHSEGSLIGMLAARQAGASAFVSLAGVAQNAAEIVRLQLKTRLSAPLAERGEAILRGLEQGQITQDVPKELTAIYRESVQPYLISWFRYNPSQEIPKLSIPVQIVHGSTDINVNVAEAEALKRAKPEAELVIVNGMNHVLKSVPADMKLQMASYNDPALPIASELSTSVTAFLRKSLK